MSFCAHAVAALLGSAASPGKPGTTQARPVAQGMPIGKRKFGEQAADATLFQTGNRRGAKTQLIVL
jgi:hypothetical protein